MIFVTKLRIILLNWSLITFCKNCAKRLFAINSGGNKRLITCTKYNVIRTGILEVRFL